MGDVATVSPVLSLRSVWRTFEGDPPLDAVADVDLDVHPGEWLAIVGPSGSGKSTLLNVLGCLDHPTDGRYLLDGVDVSELHDGERAGVRAHRIGFVFQQFHLLSARTVVENVMLADVYRRGSRRDRRDRAVAALERVGLGHRLDYLPTRLSGGERQRVAIARALMGEPSILLCDEPTGNLDSANTQAILDLMAALHREGLTLVMITHDDAVSARAQRIATMRDGRLAVAA
jgi:macrolide transport system ATP-binding/permease protein